MHSRNFDVIVVREARAIWWEHGLLNLSVWAASLFLEKVKPVGIPILQMKTLRLREAR